MPKNLESKVGESSLALQPFVTVDDCRELAEKLFSYLARLSSYKYPLGVRKGNVLKGKGVENMANAEESMMIKGTGRTYFFDVEPDLNSKRYLRITESRFKGGKPERNSLIVFPENASEFVKTFMKMVAKIG